jgi:predicted dehydrogenase
VPEVGLKMANPIRTGIVGCGGITYGHIKATRKISDVELAAVCDSNVARARWMAERFHIKRYYADLSEMIDKEKLDVLDICTPPQTHPVLAAQGMQAGCHVLTEKPMALTLEEADAMITAARVSQMQLCVVHNELFIPVVVKARVLVSDGVVGDVLGVAITDSIPWDSALASDKEHWCHKLPGGIFGEMLPHPLYLAQAFLGELEPVAVHSRKLGSRDWMAADELRVILEGKNGLATITESLNWPEDFMVLDIFGTEMSLHVDIWGATLTRYAVGGGKARFKRGRQGLEQGFQRLGGTAATALEVIFGRFRGGHDALIRQFFASIRTGIGMPVTVEEAREAVKLYQAVTTKI